MGMPSYRYTGGAYADIVNGKKHHDWADAWTNVIGIAVAGLDPLARHEVYRIIHEIRRRVEAGDYGPPEAYPAPRFRHQTSLNL